MIPLGMDGADHINVMMEKMGLMAETFSGADGANNNSNNNNINTTGIVFERLLTILIGHFYDHFTHASSSNCDCFHKDGVVCEDV